MPRARASPRPRPCRPRKPKSRLLRPAAGPKIALIGQPAEADTAQPIAARKSFTIGLAAEADTAQPVARRKIRSVGQPAVATAALPVIGRKLRAVALAAEADAALHIAGRRSWTLGRASEVDMALPLVIPVLAGYLFSPPSQVEHIATPFSRNPPGVGPRVRIREGLCVFRIDGQWHASAGPTHLDVAAADLFFAGGHIHTVTVAVAVELILAGYGAGLTPIH